MKNNRFSRRSLLQGAAVTAGALAANGLPGTNLVSRAYGQAAEKSALLFIYLQGGYNAVFPSADSFRTTGTFGITGDNMLKPLGGVNNLVVDAPTFGTLPDFALTHMASIGVKHGISDHGNAQNRNVTDGTRAYYLRLAAAMGGDAAIKAAVVGGQMPAGPRPAENGVSLQAITDMRTTIAALGGAQDPTIPDRGIAGKGLTAAQAQSLTRLNGSPVSLKSMKEGYQASIETLAKPVQAFDFNAMALAYNPAAGANPATAVNSFGQQMIAAELMIRAGSNVVMAYNGGWDTHGDRTAANVRNKMNAAGMAGILGPLKTFITRTSTLPEFADKNVVVAIMGDFSRSLPGSDHQNSLTATVIGKYVKVGTSGKLRVTGTNTNDARMTLDPAPGQAEFWSYLAAVLKVPGTPFVANPHTALVA